MGKMLKMFKSERMALLVLGIAIIAFACVLGIKQCSHQPQASVATRVESAQSQIDNAATDSVKVANKKKKSKKKKSERTGNTIQSYQRSHRDESID